MQGSNLVLSYRLMSTVNMYTDELMMAQAPKGICYEVKLLVTVAYLFS
jgi:hypothetical protein